MIFGSSTLLLKFILKSNCQQILSVLRGEVDIAQIFITVRCTSLVESLSWQKNSTRWLLMTSPKKSLHSWVIQQIILMPLRCHKWDKQSLQASKTLFKSKVQWEPEMLLQPRLEDRTLAPLERAQQRALPSSPQKSREENHLRRKRMAQLKLKTRKRKVDLPLLLLSLCRILSSYKMLTRVLMPTIPRWERERWVEWPQVPWTMGVLVQLWREDRQALENLTMV